MSLIVGTICRGELLMQPQPIILSSYLITLILIQRLFCNVVHVHVC